jgi:DNA polymerase III subunit delta'
MGGQRAALGSGAGLPWLRSGPTALVDVAQEVHPARVSSECTEHLVRAMCTNAFAFVPHSWALTTRYNRCMWAIVGQDRAVETLQAGIATGRLAHALLITGPPGVGKTTLAVELAKALNCVGTDPPCMACVHCRQIEAGGHPDVTIVEPLDGKDSISIVQVRSLRESASLKPYQGRFKVVIISGAEALTAQAADALLKTLEEPQPQVRIVLTATDPEALPATVVSRCRVITLGTVDAAAIAKLLVERGESDDRATELARLARGNVGWALRAAKQPKLAAQRQETVERLSGVFGMTLGERMDLAETLTGDRKERSAVRRNLELLLALERDVLRVREGLPPVLVSGVGQSRLEAAARQLSLDEIERWLSGTRLVMDRVDSNVDPRLALEAMLVALP